MEKELEIMEKEEYEVDTESLVTDIVAEPEIIEDFKFCIYCNEKIAKDMQFCSYCGKPQNENYKKAPENVSKKAVKKRNVKKASGKANEIAILVFSYIFFGFSMLAFVAGVYRMFVLNVATVSFFGSSTDALIVNQTYVIGDFLCSIIFLLAGMFFFSINRWKNK